MAYSPPPGQPDYGPQQPYPPYQGPYPPYQGSYPAYPAALSTNGLAIASLVCGVGTFVIGLSFIPAIICGHIARRQIRQTGEQGGGLALAGLILGYVGGALFIAAVLVIFFLAAKVSSTVSVGHGVPVPGGIPAPAIPPLQGPGN
jgi:Domain of unknown function (DUF4190)